MVQFVAFVGALIFNFLAKKFGNKHAIMISLAIWIGAALYAFSIYEISERGTSWLGPLLFGLVFQFTGNYRLALLSLITFFMIGLILLLKVDTKRAIHEAGNIAPLTAK